MSIKLNNVNATDVFFNGTRMESVQFNGSTIHNAKNGNVSLARTGAGSFSPGEEDVNRHFVVIQTQFSSSSLPNRPIPTLDGSSMLTVFNRTNYFYDDGHSVRISTIKLPTGTANVTVADTDGFVLVFRVVGCSSMATPFASTYTEGSAGVTLNTPTNGCSFLGFVHNFSGAGSTITNCDYSAGSSGILVEGADFQTTGGNISYTASYSSFFGLAAGVSFAYDYF